MDNAFTKIFGKSSQMKVFDYLIDLEVDVNVTDICEGTGFSRQTVEDILNNLLSMDLLKNTRSVGNIKLYKLNFDNKIVDLLCDINDVVLKNQEALLEKKN